MSSSATPASSQAILNQVIQHNAAATPTLQHYPALVPLAEQDPPTYPFGVIQLPAAGIFFATSLSYVSVNQSPIMPGHVLVMPRSNKQRVHSLSPVELSDLMLTAQHIATVFERKFEAEAITFAIQDGAEAGQKIPCVHMHIIPRHKKDLINKDDIYDLIEKNVPAASVLAVAKDTVAQPTRNVVVQPPSHAIVPDPTSGAAATSASTKPGALRESLDDAKRVFRTRAEQAIEAQKFATWLKEAGLPEFLNSTESSNSNTTSTHQ